MAFMSFYLYDKGALYSADCDHCGATIYHHEWIGDFESRPEAMQTGTARCPECTIGHADPATFSRAKRPHYAARYSADGYLDCTDWHYGTNKRALEREVRGLYGD